MPTARLVLEVPVFGIALLWLLGLIPAAVVTLLKDRFLYFLCGWITFGVVWFVGAFALAPPDSWWARRFYGEERLATATDPIRHPRSRRAVLLSLGGVVASVVVLGLFAARPTPVLGVSGVALQRSVGGITFEGACERQGDRIWSCGRYDDGGSGTVEYRVSMRRSGCWTATRVGFSGEGSSKRLSGCVTIIDFVF